MRLSKRLVGPWDVRREVLVGLDCIIGIQSDDPDLFHKTRKGLKGELGAIRYGLPFAGDNNLLIDRIDEMSSARKRLCGTRECNQTMRRARVLVI